MIHSEFQAILGYMRPYIKKKKQKTSNSLTGRGSISFQLLGRPRAEDPRVKAYLDNLGNSPSK